MFNRSKMRTAICVALAVSFLTVEGIAQRRTILEMVFDTNGPLNLETHADPPPISLTELVQRSEMIVRGTVTEVNSSLSSDGTDIYTDLTLGNVTFLHSAEPAIATKPGPPSPLIITQLGGTVTIAGYPVRQTLQNLPLLARGDEAIFLLVRGSGKLLISGQYLGVFGIEGNRVVPLTRTEWFAREHRGKTVDQFVREIATMAAARRQ
jgi:hypothetical protein